MVEGHSGARYSITGKSYLSPAQILWEFHFQGATASVLHIDTWLLVLQMIGFIQVNTVIQSGNVCSVLGMHGMGLSPL